MSEKFNPIGLGPTINESTEPVKNLIESFDKLYYLKGTVTSPSKFGRSPNTPEGRERPLFTRVKRAELYMRFIREKNKDILGEAHKRDALNMQYMNQREITINLPEYGEQKARIVKISPLGGKKGVPIFFIPGISNDIECVSALITETAFQGREIITAGYPESFMGHTTQAFADAVEKDSGFNPHIEFYKKVIDALFALNQEIELWGYSTGGPIVSGILNDKKYQEQTKNAVLISPAGSVEQTVTSINLGVIHEMGFIKDNSSASLNLTIASKVPKEKEQTKLRKEIMASLMKKIAKEDTAWKNARVKNNGHILVISGEKDGITKSAQKSEEFEQGNSQIKSMILQNAYHAAPQTNPTMVVSKILGLEERLETEN